MQNPGGGTRPGVLRPLLSHLSQEQASLSPWDLASQAAASLPLGFRAEEGERINITQRCARAGYSGLHPSLSLLLALETRIKFPFPSFMILVATPAKKKKGGAGAGAGVAEVNTSQKRSEEIQA